MQRTLLVLASTYPRWPNDPEPGFVHELCRRLTSHFRVIAVVPDAPGAAPSGLLEGVEVIRYRYAPRALQTLVNNGGIAANLKRSVWKWLLVPGFIVCQYGVARRVLREQHVDVVHAHWLIPQGLIARFLARRCGVPYLVTSHGGDLFGFGGWFLNRLKRRIASASGGMTVVSDAMRDEAKQLGLLPPCLDVLPMGVDLRHRFTPDATTARATDELLFVGRLVAKKGLVHLLGAMPIVLVHRPEAMLTIAGFGPEEQALRVHARRLGIEGRVRFIGAVTQPELPALYRRASVFVAPFIKDISGNQEGLPVVLMEAIGCGCPVVVGNVAGIHDLLGEQGARACVDPRDKDALAAAIIDALERPEDSAVRTAEIRQAVMEKVDWNVIANRYAQCVLACVKIDREAVA